jgi:lysophospholipase L1-like esterase
MWLDLIAAVIPVVVAAGAAQATDNNRFLALGDSYTIGEGVAVAERWPAQLVALLHAQGIALGAPEIIARTGWTTDELAAAMDDAHTTQPPYALVSLLIGVNNQYRGRDLENYRVEFRHLLERAIVLAGNRPGRVIVVSIPDWGVTRFGRGSGRDVGKIAHEIDAYNDANAQIAKMLQVRYVDVTAASRNDGDRAEMLVADGLHPSAAAYRHWVERILPAAQSALSSP